MGLLVKVHVGWDMCWLYLHVVSIISILAAALLGLRQAEDLEAE